MMSNLFVVKLVVPESCVDGISHDGLMIMPDLVREVKFMGGRRNMILCLI